MTDLMFGMETEYAINGIVPNGVVDREEILRRLMDLAREQLVHLPDLHSPGGLFLQNGSRFYTDCGLHPELCTPEVLHPHDAVRYIAAGHKTLAGLAASLEAASVSGTEIMCLRCNVDYSGSNTTWGCHESYLHRMPLAALQAQIVPHLATRLIFTGAGGFNPLSRGLEFTLSPRMAHFKQLVTGSSTSERGLWHEKSESLCAGYSRLHVLCGESLCSETANYLKIGATALIIAMAEAGLNPGGRVQLNDPLAAMHIVAADVTCKKPLSLEGGGCITAVELQRHYLEQAEAQLSSGLLPVWAAEVCTSWRAVLDQLEDAPASVAQNLDWGIKYALFADHARRLGISWEVLPFWNELIDKLVAALAPRAGTCLFLPLEIAISSKGRKVSEVAAFEPLLKANGLHWEDLKKLLASRQQFFEIDMRFGRLGPRGIFEALDQAGVLAHKIETPRTCEPITVERAQTQPPAAGRAHLRGKVIQRLAGFFNARCDWQCIVNYSERKTLDLSDPFATSESWQRMRRDDLPEVQMRRRFSEMFVGGEESAGSGEPGPLSRRQDAADRIVSGDFAGAEALLRGLLGEQFELPSTHCHMTRVLLLTNREAEAREHNGLAWALREQAESYVVCRILFFQCIFAILDAQEIHAPLGQIKSILQSSSAHLDWTIHPVLDHLRSQLGESNYRLLGALADALSSSAGLRRLNSFSCWRNAPLPGETAA